MSADVTNAPTPQRPPLDARVSIKVTPDKLTAEAVFYPPEGEGRDICWDIVNAEMGKLGIKYGVCKEETRHIIDSKTYNTSFVLAQGKPPENGKEAEFEFLFDRNKTGLPKILPDGTVDYRNLDRLSAVKARDPLLKLIPHTDGRPGISVFDTPVPQKKGKPRYIVPGKNTLLLPDGLTLISEIDGEAREQNGKVSVSDFVEIESDVGLNTGNIHFSGNIRVKGGVTSGFSVVSTNGSIEILGIVEGAHIEAECNVVLRAGMKGGDRGTIVARGDVVAKFLESCKVHANGNVTGEVVMNSEVSCRGRLDVTSGKGLIVGRTVRAGTEISGKDIGARSSVQTNLEVGIDPVSLERYKAAQKELVDQQSSLEKLSKSMDFLVKLKLSGKMTLEQMSSMGTVNKTIKAIKEKIFDLTEEIEKLTPLVEDIGKGKIRVSGVVYSGTRLAIGRSVYNVENDMKYCSFVRDGGDIKMAPY